MSANIWVPTSTTRRKGQTDVVSPETVDRNVKVLLTTQMVDNFESNSDQTTHLANISIETKREAEAAHNRTADGGRARKTQEEERTRKAMAKKNLKEKRGQEEEESLESEAEKARIIQAEEVQKQQDTLTAEEGQLEVDDIVQTPSPVNESQESEDDEACLPGNLSSPPSSPLLTARFIENLNEVAYPEGIKGPKVEPNSNVRDARFRYDRDFLLQFMHVCKLKPPTLLPTLGVLGIEPVDQASFAMAHNGSERHRNASGAMPVSANRQASVGLGIGGFQKPSASSGFQMGNFQSPGSKLTSEERFAMFNPRSASTSSATSQFRSPIVRPPSNRIRSKRGEKRGDVNKTPMSQQEHGYDAAPILGAGSEPVVPLEISANRWVPTSTTRKVQPDVDSPELVGRKVKALLNKLTMEKFETISDQIIHWANKSVNEEDGETIVQVIRLIFEHATDEPAWSEMYARLCRKIMDHIIAGNLLFHKYLLNRCQEDFERGCQWFAKEAAVATAATCVKSSDNQAIKTAHAKKGTEEAELYLGEYYNAAQEGMRQYLGLIKFISELFKMQMLNGCIMHECVRKLLGNIENLVEEKLLGNVENLVEEKIESLCQLLKTVGQLLDTPKARAHMTVYFTRMKVLCKSHNFSARMQFMLQNVFELRDRRWASRNVAAAPIVFAAVYEAATYRHLRISRGGRRLGSERKHEDGHDNGAISGGSPVRTPSKAGDLLQFGKFNDGAPIASVMGRNSVFTGSKKDSKRETPPRTNLRSVSFDLSNIAPASGAGSGPVAPLNLSANRWVPTSATPNVRPDVDSPEVVDRKVKALLNKLTTQRFDLISDQVIQWVNKSVNKDGWTLIRVIRQVFEHASDGAAWSKLYARLCWKMMEQISPEFQHDGIKNAEGKPIAGRQLFRKYLLNRCQEDFEHGWFAKEATAAKASDNHATKAANDKKGTKEAELYSEEYYAAQKTKRLGLGLTMFLGELFKRQMITEWIIHECVRKLLCNVEHPEEEELESLCQLLQMVGQLLDTRKARAQMNVYFMRMKELSEGLNVSFRMQFMLQDVIELRDRKWIRRNAIAAPTTVVAVREVTPRSPAFPGAVLNVQTQSRPGIDIQTFMPSMRPIQQPAGTPSSTKSPTSLPSQSSWAKGAPQSSSSSFASLNSSSHSRRPRALGLGVSVRDGVSVPRNNVRSVVQPGSFVFGSIDNVSVSLSSSSSSAISAVKAEVVYSFGSVPATSFGFANGKTLASALAAALSKQFPKPSSSSTPSNSRIPS